MNENGAVACNASLTPIGILAAETEAPIASGDDVNVVISGGAKWLTGEAVKAGDELASDADGKAVKATSGKVIFAQALGNAAAGEAVDVLITRGGVKA